MDSPNTQGIILLIVAGLALWGVIDAFRTGQASTRDITLGLARVSRSTRPIKFWLVTLAGLILSLLMVVVAVLLLLGVVEPFS